MSTLLTPTPQAFRRRPMNLAILAACAALGQPAGAAIIEFTGLAPVYTASLNGSTTEFQFSLDWQGYCNANPAATCASTTFWSVPFNWDANRLPGLADEVRTPAGSVVVISPYSSVYKGSIPGSAFASTLSAEGQIRLGLGGFLRTDSGSIVDLFMGGGTLETQGLVILNNLSQALGSLQGSGTTRVLGASTSTFDPFIRAGHTVEFYGSYGGAYGGSFGSTGPRLEAGAGSIFNPEPGARLINYGILDGATLLMQGSANALTLPRLINRGTLTGGLNPGTVRVDNEGAVVLGDGGAMSFGPAGAHTGSFAAGINSVLTFGGPWGHELLPGSSLSSEGKVVFTAGVHEVQGSYDAHETEVVGDGTFLTVQGSLSHMPKLRVNAGFGEVRFETPAAVSVGELTLDSGYVIFDVAPGSNPRPTSTVQTLTLNGGTFNSGLAGGPSTPVNVVNPLIWNAGNLGGAGAVTALGGIEINATTAANRGLFGLLRNAGTANWHGGVINWGGTFENLAGATFNLNGDFSAGSGGFGRFVNAGSFVKTAGSGTATLGMAFDNSSLVQVQAGTLRLNGGGTHDGGRFEALPGALIELSGGTVLKGAVTTAGRVDITGGSLSLLTGASFTNAAGNSVNVSSFTNGTAATFVTFGGLNVSGVLENQGSFTNHHPAASVGSLTNAGTLNNVGNLNVLGDVGNGGTLNNIGGLVIGGGLNNTGNFRNDGVTSSVTVAGAFSSLAGGVVNEGNMEFQGGDVEFGGTGTNLGTVRNGGGSFTVLSGASLVNHGNVVNDFGTVYVQAGGVLGGSGRYEQTGGLTVVKGTLQADAGIDIQGGILRGGRPPGAPSSSLGTVIGNVDLHGQPWRWEPGNTPGTFTVLGNVTVQGDASRGPGDGNIEIEFDSPSVHDRIVVSGTVTLHEASIDLVFAPGFAALDGDSFGWLSAGDVVLPNGSGTIVYNVSGLSGDWQATPFYTANGASLDMVNLLATPIPTSGSHTVASGEQAYNDGFATLDDLGVAGNLSNRLGGFVTTGNLDVAAGGRMLNRGTLEAFNQVVNAGELINRRDSQFSHSGMVNTGSLVNEGQLTGWGDFVNEGRVVNSGQFQAWTFTNGTGGELVNEGVFSHTGQFVNQAGGRVENRGTMTAEGPIVNRGEFLVSGNLQNNAPTFGPAFFTGSILNTGGTFTVEAGGTVAGPGTYLQSQPESITRVNGTLAATDITILQGVLSGNGTLTGPVTLGSPSGFGAAVRPGNSPGTLTVDGSLNAYYATFDIELAGPNLYDRIVVNGDASFTDGVVNFLLRTPDGISFDFMPTAGDRFTWLSVGGTASGLEGLNWNLNVVGDGWYSTLASSYWGSTSWNGLQITFNGDHIEFAAPIPEPETWAMLLAGLGLVGWAARRRTASCGGAGSITLA